MALVRNILHGILQGSAIVVVENYSALPDPTTVEGKFYWTENSQGTSWLPGGLGGTYYNSGMYYSNGISWSFLKTPYQATQAEVNTGTNTDKFVTPSTFENANKWTTKQDLLVNPITGTGTANRLPKFTSSSAIGNSILQEVSTTAKGISIQSITPTNTAFGYAVLSSASLSGVSNTGFGHNILSALTTGSNNSAFGYDVLKGITNGNNNTGFGFNCLSALLTGSENSSFGYLCFNNLTSGSANVVFGVGAGRFIADGVTPLTTCNQSVFLGNLTKSLANTAINEVVIGYNAIGAGSNTATIGNTSIVDTILRGRVNLTQYATGSRPSYVKGALIYDSTLGKLVIGGNSGWEVVTSV